MKQLQNLHTHSVYCDGKDTLEEMIETCMAKGFTSLGFSGHSYMSFAEDHSMSLAGTEAYKEEVLRLKEKYKDSFPIFLGLEVEMYSEVDLSGYEYLIGSSHYFDFDGKKVGFDRSADEVRRVIQTYFDGDGMAYARKYYENLARLPEYGDFDILGHCDLITKHSEKEHFFDTSSNEYKEYANYLKKYVVDTIELFHNAMEENKKIVCEGAQATLLDIDFGSYPYVTSSNPSIGGICTGTGIGARNIGEVYGVLKAYSSRVGEGPYITEEKNEIGDKIRELGHEYGTTTKRPRRCGWLDLVALKYAARINGLTGLAINHVDTIGKLEKIKLCVGYKYKENINMKFSADEEYIKDCEPIYEEFDGNFGDISKITKREDLPENAKKYLNRIEEIVKVPIKFIGTGPARENMIINE